MTTSHSNQTTNESHEQIDWKARGMQTPGCTGGFHYGNAHHPCNGVYHATDRITEDGRQIYVCDACSTEGIRTQ